MRHDPDGQQPAAGCPRCHHVCVMAVRQIRSSMGAVVHVQVEGVSSAQLGCCGVAYHVRNPPACGNLVTREAVGILDLHGRHLTARRVPQGR